MAKIVLKKLSDAKPTDILCQGIYRDGQITALGYLKDYFVSGGHTQVRIETPEGEIIPMSIKSPNIPQSWFIVNDDE